MSTELLITSVLLGVGLAMDAFSVSIANGLADSGMKTGRMLSIAGTFAGFQFMMPMIGWFLVTEAARLFKWFSPLIPWIALVLLLIIGGGLGNLFERVFLGYVTDYLSLSFFPPICNFADYCITAGTVCLIVYLLFFSDFLKSDGKKKKADE